MYAKYSSENISKYCIYYCSNVLNRPISNLQLQKILYYIQAAFLVKQVLPSGPAKAKSDKGYLIHVPKSMQ